MQHARRHFGALVIVIVLLGGWVCLAQTVTEPSTTLPNDTLVEEAHLPLTSGNVDLGQLLGQLFDWLGIQSKMVRQQCANMQIPVTGTIGQIKLESLGQLTQGVITFQTTDSQLIMRVDRLALRQKNKAIRTQFREKMQGWFPDLARQAYDQNGLWSIRPGGSLANLPRAFQMKHVVVLVHGLDEPGDIWDELITALQQAGHTPLVFIYPNDQPIVDSAKLLAEHLGQLQATGITHISIVAHSMGGLVSREMLTHSDLKGYPTVTRLITVGTPNHGSPLAHLRIVGEMRDQLVRTFSGNGVMFGSVFDGAGEAEIDLLPGSAFLTTLNARSLPKGVAMTSIIGIASPVKMSEIQAFEKRCQEFFKGAQQEKVTQVRGALEQLVQGFGDGCVSLESAHLDGVTDEVIVEANHRSLLRTIPILSHGQPPAIPIVLDRLSAEVVQNQSE